MVLSSSSTVHGLRPCAQGSASSLSLFQESVFSMRQNSLHVTTCDLLALFDSSASVSVLWHQESLLMLADSYRAA